jgi:hypothetical protein
VDVGGEIEGKLVSDVHVDFPIRLVNSGTSAIKKIWEEQGKYFIETSTSVYELFFETKQDDNLEKQIDRKNSWSGFNDIFNDIMEKKKHLEQELKMLSYTTETFEKQEVQRISEIKQKLNRYVDELEMQTQSFDIGSPEYIKINNRYLDKVILFLDEQYIWTHKFSTECSGGSTADELIITPDDSIYYTTQDGISLRLKRANLGKGLRRVIQPFMEKILFDHFNKRRITTEPKIGYSVKEYMTKDFLNKQNKDPDDIHEDYHSTIKTYYKDSKIYHVETSKTTHVHDGDRVNKHFELRTK